MFFSATTKHVEKTFPSYTDLDKTIGYRRIIIYEKKNNTY